MSSVFISLMCLIDFWKAIRRTSKWISSRCRLSKAFSWKEKRGGKEEKEKTTREEEKLVWDETRINMGDKVTM